MKDKIICFSLGLAEENIEKGKASFAGQNKEAPVLEVMAITEKMLAARVGDILDSVFAQSGFNSGAMRLGEENALSSDLYKYRVVIVHSPEQAQVLQIMRSFKAVLPDPQNIIFAVITATALTWTFADYIEHLGQEHEYRMAGK